MPPSTVDIHPDAIAEGREARRWYRSKSVEAEESFRREIERAIGLIGTTPGTWPRYLAGTRRFILRTFPYSLIYRERGALVLVVAVAHAKRRPGYWRSRLRDR